MLGRRQKPFEYERTPDGLRFFETDQDQLRDIVTDTRYFVARADERQLSVGGNLKRAFDIAFALSALLTAGAMMLFIAAWLKLRSRGPVVYAHERVGADGKRFRCLKFRTMVVDSDEQLAHLLESDPAAAAEFAQTHKLKNDPRIVPGIGAFLRKTSLDELPQFLNVLMGDMSVVGPRPVTAEEFYKHYGTGHSYTKARPGVTGMWQVSGRNEVGYSDRVKMDEDYVRNWSLSTDLLIIAKTVSVVCVNPNGQ